MIYQILGFTIDKQNIFFRRYAKDTLSHETISKTILKSTNQNIIYKKGKKLIYKKYNDVIIAFVVNQEENNFYIFDIIDNFMNAIKILFHEFQAPTLLVNFDLILVLLDEYILGGKVLEFNNKRILEMTQKK
ncbi:Sigma-adaptin 3A [Binucleata daphniae]